MTVLDIISEILETDRAAEEVIEKAGEQRIKMLADCEEEIARIRENAEQEIKEHRRKAVEKSSLDKDRHLASRRQDEEEKLKSFETLFEDKHEEWEKELFDAVVGKG